MYVGIDIGYSSVKLCFGTEAHPIQQQLPVGAAAKTQMLRGQSGEVLVGAGYEVMVNDEEWVAGINPDDIQGFARIMDHGYPQTPEYLALFRAALCRVNVKQIDILVTGLPMFQFATGENCRALRDRLKGRHYIRPDFLVDVKE